MMTRGMMVLEVTMTKENLTAKTVTDTVIADTMMMTPIMAIIAEIPPLQDM